MQIRTSRAEPEGADDGGGGFTRQLSCARGLQGGGSLSAHVQATTALGRTSPMLVGSPMEAGGFT